MHYKHFNKLSRVELALQSLLKALIFAGVRHGFGIIRHDAWQARLALLEYASTSEDVALLNCLSYLHNVIWVADCGYILSTIGLILAIVGFCIQVVPQLFTN